MSHPFGNLLKRYLSRKHGLSQTKLAQGVYVDPAVITRMCQVRGLVRDRILDIIVWFQKEEVFESAAEANALLQAAGLAELNPDQPKQREILCKLKEDTQPVVIQEKSSLDDRSLNIRRRRRIYWGVVATVIPVMLLIPFLVWTATKPKPAIWQEDFSPLDNSKWSQISARWEDINGPTARLIEANPNSKEDFGKVESQIITVNVDAYPFLRVKVTAIDLNSSYTIQILDQRTQIAKNISSLQEVRTPDVEVRRINLAQEMGWEEKGVQSFTINIWVGGRGKSVTFDLISIGAD